MNIADIYGGRVFKLGDGCFPCNYRQAELNIWKQENLHWLFCSHAPHQYYRQLLIICLSVRYCCQCPHSLNAWGPYKPIRCHQMPLPQYESRINVLCQVLSWGCSEMSSSRPATTKASILTLSLLAGIRRSNERKTQWQLPLHSSCPPSCLGRQPSRPGKGEVSTPRMLCSSCPLEADPLG